MTPAKNILLLCAVALLLAGCGPATNESANARQPKTSKVTTRWKWNANSQVAASKGLIIEQDGDAVEVSFVHLKDGDGFVVDKQISRGRYFPATRQIILPPTTMTPDEFDMAIQMDVPRIQLMFDPDAKVLKAKWVGKGGPNLSMDFVRLRN